MGHRFGWIALVGMVVIGLAVGALGYNIGVSQGLAMAVPAGVQGAPGTAVPFPPYMWYRPWGFGFGPLFLLIFFFLALRSLLWGGFYRRRWYAAHRDEIPQTFEEWHRRAHEQMTDPQHPQSPMQPPSRA